MSFESQQDPWERGPEYPPAPLYEQAEDEDTLEIPRSEAEQYREAAANSSETEQTTDEIRTSS